MKHAIERGIVAAQEQGLPRHVEDPVTLDKIARILLAHEAAENVPEKT